MFLEKLRLHNFRCYQDQELEFDSKFNVFTGLNGQGKTSVLEAIYVLANLKSFRASRNQELIRDHQDVAFIQGQTRLGDITNNLELSVKGSQKQSRINGKHCKFLTDYLGKLAAVTFSPTDLEIIRGAPSERRAWIDRAISIIESEHLSDCVNYNKAMQQKNRLLKQDSRSEAEISPEVDIWNEQLANYGAKIIHRRISYLPVLNELCSKHYKTISKSQKELKIEGEVTGQATIPSVDSISQNLREKLQKNLAKERLLGVTLVGPHRDDILILLGEQPIRTHGSQGEVRSAALSLRFAEVDLHEKYKRISPVLLIDDFSSELDQERRNFLLEYLKQTHCQVFVTTTENLELGKVFKISEGKVSPNVC